MFEWINSKDNSAREKFDTDMIESWDQVNQDGLYYPITLSEIKL